LLTLELPTVGTFGNLTIPTLSGFLKLLPLLFIAGMLVLVTVWLVFLACGGGLEGMFVLLFLTFLLSLFLSAIEASFAFYYFTF